MQKIYFFNLIVFLLFCSFYAPLQGATLVYSNDFESAKLNDFKCSGNCPELSSHVNAVGQYAASFMLKRTMPVPFRTEVVLNDRKGDFQFNQEYWIGFSYRREEWERDSTSESSLQMYPTPGSWHAKCSVGSTWSTAPIFIVTYDDTEEIRSFNRTLWKGPVSRQQWANIVLHFRLSPSLSGLVEAWKDGVKLGRLNGVNSFATDKCGNPMKNPFLKLGVYKWPWKKGKPQTEATRRQLLIDDLKIAVGADGYSLVNSMITTKNKLSPADKATTLSAGVIQ